jgi:hypothetical protein
VCFVKVVIKLNMYHSTSSSRAVSAPGPEGVSGATAYIRLLFAGRPMKAGGVGLSLF